MSAAIDYTLVIPMKNEAGNILALFDEIEQVMKSIGAPWELICIDDGSTDQTKELLLTLATQKNYLRLIIFEGNYGQSSAFDAGFKQAKGEFIITLDGDRQNDPADIPKLILASQSYDLVCGVRQKRKDSVFKRFTSLIANQLRSRLCQDGMQDTGCSLKIYRTACFKKIKLYEGMHRFLPALFKIEGFRIHQIPVNHRQRLEGQTKYTLFNRSFNTIFDLFAVYWMRKRQLNYRIKEPLS